MSDKKIRKKYKKLYTSVEEILFRHDPIRINFGRSTDEYDPEVGTIMYRLKDALSESDVYNIIYEEFVKWFGTGTGWRKRPACLQKYGISSMRGMVRI